MTETELRPASVFPLLKARIRHTRIFVALLLLLVIFSLGALGENSLILEVGEWVGLALIVLCVLGRSYCSAFIGGRKNDELVQEGPFSIVRNPLYVFSFLGVVGIGMQSGRLTLLTLLIAGFALYYPRVVAREEAFLKAKFGRAYLEYMLMAPRWWPRWKNWREPEFITTQPRLLRETMRDAAMFFIALPIFELLNVLHENNVIPTLLWLP